ncbi:methyltransferase domain-containing protein [Mycolicibacterium holsaticum]|jgi:ubiquinone/menaquinone biosynthesis C-methylase UbiE|uniref:Methyltransferase domain-containing protein n=1 Tax=Mycolicibacterium holsaticum TaxID=152142 RepID=A0A1E3RXZ8_9MYCO|nr:methyltransferase domain-containing protein [Mycolicibacterium holsaticum]NLG56532.1 methyltransferase domain-containing protein [Rhodococcus sp. (in: high G+C Gram-positive bacteria)]MDA4110029.1 hypothetical protein [Mycolicibacterium holsaticum DSM 44478 = JCM 12374]ODQ94718.1 hypothetical protein BHQ17_07940 [Mycolicibacterium holsaticum]QZA12055.1 methyltransferase domain-containing protein [Mycolicibacterium holsaticum DSM 44478 = JCM 12374]UNC10459.1 methyltransferase domain-containi
MYHGGAFGGVGEYISYLDDAETIATAPKRASISALALLPGDAVLDVGCGTGGDVRHLAESVGATGRAVGLDESPEMIATAGSRAAAWPNVEFIVGDAAEMPFADDEFAAARVERALQHMRDPASAVAEMARVVRSGGRIVAMEPDWDTLAISAANLEITRKVVRKSAERFRHPDSGRRLPEWFARAGIDILRVEASAVPIRSVEVADEAFRLTPVARALGAEDWLEDLRVREMHNAFIAYSMGVGVVGQVR